MSDGAHMLPMMPSDADLIVDMLMYRSYAYTRTTAPHIPVANYVAYYPNAGQLEARFQMESIVAKVRDSSRAFVKLLERK